MLGRKSLPVRQLVSRIPRSKWPEFDLGAAQWDIPAERMKMGKPHRVFLSRQAVEILRQVRVLTGHGEYVFPSIFRGSVPMGDVTLNHFFKRIDFGVPDFSPHGTRGTAATLLREHGQLVVEIEHEHGSERVRTPSIFIGNNALQLEQVGLEEAEAVKRWRLAAVIVQPVGTSELIGLALRGLLGRLGEDDRVRNFAFQTMTVRPLSGVSKRGIKVAVDGEIFWCQPPMTCKVAPQPLMLLAPAASLQ